MKYIEGKGGWRFLDNDSNRSVDQFTGKRLLTHDEIDNWKAFLSAPSAQNFLTLIAPAKEEVVPFLYPYPRANLTPIDQLLKLDSRKKLLYPLEILRRSWDVTYTGLDTHWSDHGACIAAALVAKHFNTPSDALNSIPFIIKSHSGDLGGKSEPPIMSEALFFRDHPRAKYLAFDNGIPNHGRTWIFNNPNAPMNRKLAIFGDSFSINMAPALSLVFRHVFYAHTAAQPDMQLLRIENPDHVVLQTNQRFITTPPSLDVDLLEIARRKLSALNRETRSEMRSRMIERDSSLTSIHIGKCIRTIHKELDDEKPF